MTRIRIFWIALAIIVLIVAAIAFPIDLFENYGVMAALALGVLVGFLSFLALAEVKTLSEMRTAMYDKDAKANTLRNVLIPFAVFLFSSFLIHTIVSYRIEHLLKTQGVFTQATIDAGQEEITRRRANTTSTYYIKISYTDKQTGKTHTVSSHIDRNIYEKLYLGQQLEVLYLPKHPTIFRLITGDNITRYKQQQNRKLRLQDLDGLFGYNSPDEVLTNLRKISPTWQEDPFEEGDETIIEDGISFYNEQLQENFMISPHGFALYQSTPQYDFIGKVPLEKAPEQGDSSFEDGVSQKTTLYETANYSLQKMEIVSLKGGASMQTFYLIKKK